MKPATTSSHHDSRTNRAKRGGSSRGGALPRRRRLPFFLKNIRLQLEAKNGHYSGTALPGGRKDVVAPALAMGSRVPISIKLNGFRSKELPCPRNTPAS